jgi:hypothetical protein
MSSRTQIYLIEGMNLVKEKYDRPKKKRCVHKAQLPPHSTFVAKLRLCQTQPVNSHI